MNKVYVIFFDTYDEEHGDLTPHHVWTICKTEWKAQELITNIDTVKNYIQEWLDVEVREIKKINKNNLVGQWYDILGVDDGYEFGYTFNFYINEMEALG